MMPSGVNNLADQLFAEKPARDQEDPFDPQTGAHRYVQSRVFSGSRGLNSHEPPDRLADDALELDVLHADRLGPYERQLLASLLRAPQSMILVTGSTGAGKSSTLRHILDFYDKNARPKSGALLGWNPRHAYVDFNKLEREFNNAEGAHSGSGLKLLYDKIPWRIANALLKSVGGLATQRKCVPRQIVLELAREAHSWVCNESDVPNGAEFDWPDLLVVGAPELNGDTDRNWDALQQRLAKVAREHERCNIPLLFWCAVFDALAIKSLPTGKKALLVLDNIDPLPDFAQRALRDEFIGLCIDKNFRVVLALRHSRFRLHETKLKDALKGNWYPHCGPSPVEIVCHRLLGFIAKPNCYPAFRDLNREWQLRTLQRAIDLLLRLTRGSPHFRNVGQLAIAGAGDSVRRALDTICSMFECREISFDYMNVETIEAISQLSVELQAISCSGTLGLALREEIIGVAMECASENIGEDVINRWAKSLANTAHAVLRGGFDKPDVWLKPQIDRLWEQPEVQSMFVEDIETAAGLLHQRLVCLGTREYDAKVLRAQLARKLKVALEELCSEPHKHAGFRALVDRIAQSLASDHGASEHAKEDGVDFMFSWDRLRICANALSANRSHVIARSLIRSERLHNLFIDSHRNVSLLPLTLLYYLAFQDDGETSLKPVLALASTDADKTEVLKLVNRLCNHEKGRVLWINQDFSHDSYEELEKLADEGATVRLTHGGWAYYLAVLDEIDYLMETVPQAGGMREELLSARLNSALRQLESMLNLRVRTVEHDALWDAIQKGVVADVIVRCTPGLIRALRGHFSKMQDLQSMRPELRYAESRDTRAVCIHWLKLLERAKERTSTAPFSTPHLSPAKNTHLVPLGRLGRFRGLGPVNGACQKRCQNAINAIESLLRGNDLWAPYLEPDAFRAQQTIDEPDLVP